MRRTFAGLAATVVVLLAVAPAARADDSGDQSQLGGFVTGAAGWAASFQPFLPALLPTGDAPAETTFSLSTTNLKSGGQALGRAAIFYPGSAGANLGPLLGQAGAAPIVPLVPNYPLNLEANADTGEKTIGVDPAVVMRVFGSPERAEGDVRSPKVDFPGVLTIDSVSSDSTSEVTDVDVTSTCEVHLEGVSLLGGAIKIKEIHSRSLSRSTGSTSTNEGTVEASGLTISGVTATLGADGIHTVGLPPPAPGLPIANPDAQLNTILKTLGVSITLTRPIEHVKGGSADRLANGVFITIINPAVAKSHLDITLASTASSAAATLPPEANVSGADLTASGPDISGAPSAPAPADTGFGSSELGGLALGPPASQSGAASTATNNGGGTGVSGSLAGYHFKGVSWQLVVVLLLISALVARWLRRFLQTRLLS